MSDLEFIGSVYLAEAIAVLVLAMTGGTTKPGRVIAELWGWTTALIVILAVIAKTIEWAL